MTDNRTNEPTDEQVEAADAVVTEDQVKKLAHVHARETYGTGTRAVDQRYAFEQGVLFALALFRGGAK